MLRCLIALSLGIAAAAQAQTVSGRVTDRASGFPIAGVVVSALDAGGNPLVRTVTDSASGYRIALMQGAITLHFRRIGYSPARVAITDTVAGKIDVILTRLPTQLPPVKAMVAAQCDANANQPDVLALWEESRSGLLTSMVARQAKAGYTSVFVYQTSFDGDDELPRTVERIELPPGVSQPFGSGGDPAFLAKNGYVVRDGFQEAFVAPDDRVLFDESFLTSHCFTIDESRVAQDSLIGIRFTSGKGSKVVGVQGTAWLHQNPLDLAFVEYDYTNVSRAMQRVRPGGSIQFRRMPSGITMVAEWRIRGGIEVVSSTVGSMRQAPRPGGFRLPRGGTPVRSSVVSAVEMGAIIELMQWPDAPPYVAPLATVSGTLLDKYSGKPLPNTPIRFYNTPFVTTTDSFGAFRFVDVLPGMYNMDAGAFDLERFGAAGDLIGPVAIKFGENANLQLRGEGPEASVVRGCTEKVDGRVEMPKALGGKNAIFGVITTDRGGQPPSNQQFFVEVTPAGAVPGTPAFPLKGKADQWGRFRVCGLPAGSVRIRAPTKSGMVGTLDLTIDPAKPLQLATVKLPLTTGR